MRFFKFTFYLLSALGVCGSARAESLLIKLDPKGTNKTINVPAGFNGTVSAYVTVTGNESQYLNFALSGPGTLRVNARGTVSKGNLTKLLAQKSNWTTVNFLTSKGGEVKEFKVSGSSAQTAVALTKKSGTADNYCQGFSAAELDATIASVKAATGQIIARDTLCADYRAAGVVNPRLGGDGTGGGLGGSSGSGGGGSAYGGSGGATGLLVHKNTCGMSSKSSYLVRFDINVSGVSAANKAAGYVLNVSAVDINYQGSKAGSLKPSSDGKYGPHPLLLLSSTGGYGGEHVNVLRWSGAKYSLQTLKVQDYVGYRGLSLARVVADSALRGGKGTVEIQSQSGIYSDCFSLSRSRQNVNGYHN